MNILTIVVKSTEFKGWPKIRIFLGQELLFDLQLVQEVTSIDIRLNETANYIKVERYGKTDDQVEIVNGHIVRDQLLEVQDLLVDGIKIPDWFKYNQSYIEYDSVRHNNSTVLGPNGIWVLNFKTPFITFFLDSKIKHEAKYNQDYNFPWSYKLGPDSVKKLSAEFTVIKDLINKHL